MNSSISLNRWLTATLACDPNAFWVRVSSGTRQDAAYEGDRNAAITAGLSALKAALRCREEPDVAVGFDTQCYTYIGLYVGRPYVFLDGRWYKTKWCHHVTVAYLPELPSSDLCTMDRVMNDDVVKTWIATRADCQLHRPLDCLGVRQIETVADHEDIWLSQHRGPIIEYSREELEQLCDSGNVHLLNRVYSPRDDEERAAIMRYYWRDVGRVHAAWDRDAQIEVHPKRKDSPVWVQLCRNANVGNGSELHNLLYYLREMLIYRFQAFHMEPCENVGLHHDMSWHITGQTGCPELHFDDATLAWLEELAPIPAPNKLTTTPRPL